MAVVWQAAQAVGAAPPLNSMVPGVPWHDWQNRRSCLAASPWNAALVGSRQVAPRMCGVVSGPWHKVLLKHPEGMPAGAGFAGCFGGLFGDPGKWHAAQTGALATFVLVWVLSVTPKMRHGGSG